MLALRLVDRFGKGIRSSPRDALIADVVAPADRGRAFGLHEAMDHLGAVIGPLAASGLMLLGFGMPTVFLASAVPALAACLVVALVVRESPRAPGLGGHRGGDRAAAGGGAGAVAVASGGRTGCRAPRAGRSSDTWWR